MERSIKLRDEAVRLRDKISAIYGLGSVKECTFEVVLAKRQKVVHQDEQAYGLRVEEERMRRTKDEEEKEMPEVEGRWFNSSKIRGIDYLNYPSQPQSPT
ncbi:hypothetical protein ACP6JB_001255 [Aspergillus fumigatus]